MIKVVAVLGAAAMMVSPLVSATLTVAIIGAVFTLLALLS
jgi:hypothetical protein